jgi:RNA methyltransferase, TrmH family
MLSKSKIKYIQSLRQKKYRDEAGVFVAEGPKVVQEFLESPNIKLEDLFFLKGSNGFNGTAISSIELEKISGLVTPNEVLAIFRKPVYDSIASPEGKLSLALDSIQDPGNLGTILRTADWFGIEQVFCSLDTVDVFNAKVVQSTMGSIGRVQVIYTDLPALIAEYPGLPVYAATLDGDDLYTMERPSNGLIVIGNESRGVSEAVLSKATHKIFIPRKGKAESLNASVAAAIILSEFCR